MSGTTGSEAPHQVPVRGRGGLDTIVGGAGHPPPEQPTGQALADTLQASPHREIDLSPRRGGMPVRDVEI